MILPGPERPKRPSDDGSRHRLFEDGALISHSFGRAIAALSYYVWRIMTTRDRQILRPRIEPPTPATLARAAAALMNGQLVAFPTETVYGLGADATNDRAVAAIFAAKARPRFNPLIVHVPDFATVERLALPQGAAAALAERFWPGPLTLVLPRRRQGQLSLLVSAGLDNVAVRAPDHPVAQALLRAAGVPLAAPSANPSGALSPTTAAHAAEGLGEKVALVLDGGPCAIGIESTVVRVEAHGLVLLRPGAITRAQLEEVVPRVFEIAPSAGQPEAPGQLASHYAPRLPVRLNAGDVTSDEALLAFGPDPLPGAAATCNLSPRGDLVEAAAHLFAMLRALDQPGRRAIAVMPIPDKGLGEAINDRLRRAAAPRPLPVEEPS